MRLVETLAAAVRIRQAVPSPVVVGARHDSAEEIVNAKMWMAEDKNVKPILLRILAPGHIWAMAGSAGKRVALPD